MRVETTKATATVVELVGNQLDVDKRGEPQAVNSTRTLCEILPQGFKYSCSAYISPKDMLYQPL